MLLFRFTESFDCRIIVIVKSFVTLFAFYVSHISILLQFYWHSWTTIKGAVFLSSWVWCWMKKGGISDLCFLWCFTDFGWVTYKQPVLSPSILFQNCTTSGGRQLKENWLSQVYLETAIETEIGFQYYCMRRCGIIMKDIWSTLQQYFETTSCVKDGVFEPSKCIVYNIT